MKKNEIPSNLYDINLEANILASFLYSSDTFDEVYGSISPSDFYYKHHSDIFEAMLSCATNNDPLDEVFIKKRLGAKYNEEAFLNIVSLNSVIDIKKYIDELKTLAIKRDLLNIAYKIPSTINEHENVKNAVDDISSEIYSLIDENQIGQMKNIHLILKEFSNEIKEAKIRKDDLVGLDTGYNELNEITKGFKNGELIIVAARPGMGKTAFALNAIRQTLKDNKGVVFFSLEMPATQLMTRMLACETSIEMSSLMTGKIDDSEFSRLNDAMSEMISRKLFVYDSGYINVHQLKNQLRKLKQDKHNNISLCVIDYIGLMTSTSNYSERHLQISEISRGLKLLARELDIPIIALSQLNRALESRANKRPMLSDLRESGAIEQDADTIMFVYRDEVYREQEEKERAERAKIDGKEYEPKYIPNQIEESAEIIVGKNRHGSLGSVKLIFQKKYSRFVSDSGFNGPTQSAEFKE